MSLAASKAQLAVLTKELLNRWQQTKDSWRDTKAAEFDAQYIQPLDTQVNAAVTAIEKLDKILAKVRNDCE